MKKSIKNVLKKKNILITLLLIVIIATVIILINSGAITKLGNAIRKNIFALDEEDQETNAYYTVGAVNGEYLTCQIAFENARGIEKVIADGVEIDGKGRAKVGIDRVLQEGEEKEYRVKLVGVDTEEVHTIYATAVVSSGLSINITNNDTLGDGTTKTVEIKGYPNNENLINQYSLDGGTTWQEYTENIDVLETESRTITAKVGYKNNNSIKKKDGMAGPLIISESLLSAIEKGVIKDNSYVQIAIKDERYTIHAYVKNGNITMSSNQIFGNGGDVGTANSYAKNMVIVKVNGDLTINSGVTLTAYNTTYGGPKGMLIYVTGNLTNNGTISMTAKGAKAVGQNVYLWKNTDASYEFVPMVGANGGKGVEIQEGRTNGANGKNRQTRRRRFWRRTSFIILWLFKRRRWNKWNIIFRRNWWWRKSWSSDRRKWNNKWWKRRKR